MWEFPIWLSNNRQHYYNSNVCIECGSFSSIVSGGEIYIPPPTGEEFTRLFQESEMKRYTSLLSSAPLNSIAYWHFHSFAYAINLLLLAKPPTQSRCALTGNTGKIYNYTSKPLKYSICVLEGYTDWMQCYETGRTLSRLSSASAVSTNTSLLLYCFSCCLPPAWSNGIDRAELCYILHQYSSLVPPNLYYNHNGPAP